MKTHSMADDHRPLLESHRGPVHIESVVLAVRDLDRVTRFYRDVIGLTVLQDAGDRIDLGNDGVLLLTLVSDPQAKAPPEGMPGLFHTAFLLPERRDLGLWMKKAADHQWQLEGMADHLVSEAVYLSDPEGNGIEIYVDRPRTQWTHLGPHVKMANARLDVPSLMALASEHKPGAGTLPTGARIGHVHLSVNTLEEATTAIEKQWGLAEMCRYPGAVFYGSGGYHHHLAVNIWSAHGIQKRDAGFWGLRQVTLAATNDEARSALENSWLAAGGKTSDGITRLSALSGLTFALASAAV
jgi:catechol 2,3-dioxygenase